MIGDLIYKGQYLNTYNTYIYIQTWSIIWNKYGFVWHFGKPNFDSWSSVSLDNYNGHALFQSSTHIVSYIYISTCIYLHSHVSAHNSVIPFNKSSCNIFHILGYVRPNHINYSYNVWMLLRPTSSTSKVV